MIHTTRKTTFRKMGLLTFLLLTVMVLLVACKTTGTGQEGTRETESTTAEESETLPSDSPLQSILVESGVSAFTIVYPDSPDEATFNVVKTLKNEIFDATGVTLPQKDDFIRKGQSHDAEAYEILVGITNYGETETVLSDLLYNDYAIRTVGNKLVITAHTSSGLSRAVNYFTKTLMKDGLSTEGGSVSLVIQDYVFRAKNAVESIRIKEAELKDFTIVYADGDDNYLFLAEKLQSLIAEEYGYILPFVSEKETTETEHEVLVGPVNRQQTAGKTCDLMSYRIEVADGKLCFFGGGPYSVKSAIFRFQSRYLNSGEKKFTFDNGILVEDALADLSPVELSAGADVRVMTANILAEFETWGGTTPVSERSEIFAAIVRAYLPDVIGLQEVTSQWDVTIPRYLGDLYDFVYMHTPDKMINYSTIIYRKDLYDVVDSGVHYFSIYGPNTIRLVTWAVFESKETHARFALFNTHWCWDSEEHALSEAKEEAKLIDSVMKKYPVPFFCTADYNTIQEKPNYEAFKELAGVVDAKYVARAAGTLLNEVGGCGVLGSGTRSGGNSIDHIFLPKNYPVLAFATVIGYHSYNLSDHSPKYADVSLQKTAE